MIVYLRPLSDRMRLLSVVSILALQAGAALVPFGKRDIESRATTPAAPGCTSGSEAIVNGAFYGYPNQDTYAPFKLAPTVGNPGCKYTHGYTPCLGNGGFGAGDPDCLYVDAFKHSIA